MKEYSMSYARFANALSFCLGALTEEFIKERYDAYLKGNFEKQYPELSNYFFIIR